MPMTEGEWRLANTRCVGAERAISSAPSTLQGVEIRELPNVDQPVVTISGTYQGATPETIDAQVTSLIESAVARVQGVASISSQSSYGQSRVTVTFGADTDLNVAASDVRDQGLSVAQAIRQAATIRLRPVMMTMISTVIGGLPLVLASGAGAEAREALGWIVVGGLGFATIFTLYLIPVFYSLLTGFAKPRAKKVQQLEAELVAAAGVMDTRADRAADEGPQR